MTVKTRYYYRKGLEKLRLGKGLLLAIPFSILMWIIILVVLF